VYLCLKMDLGFCEPGPTTDYYKMTTYTADIVDTDTSTGDQMKRSISHIRVNDRGEFIFFKPTSGTCVFFF